MVRSDNEETVALVLQGGGALGAYQAGAFEALAAAGLTPSWIAGISIGAINAALIAGNAPERRAQALREFWTRVTLPVPGAAFLQGAQARLFFNETSASMAALAGAPGFFRPRVPPAFLRAPCAPGADSLYDTEPLRETLLELVDFERVNAGETRLSVGAVNVRTGNFAYFDSAAMKIGPEHVMASGALPPGFPAVMIDGEPYWDGGLVSNTPLQYVLDADRPGGDLCVFQVDLFSARGPAPRTLADVEQRAKDIRFSSRTRLNTDVAHERALAHAAARRLAAKLPPEFAGDPDLALLTEAGSDDRLTIVHLIHRRAAYETGRKDYEFSRLSMREHWAAGADDVSRSLASDGWRHRPRHACGVTVLDLADA